jgi:hypothetical protein
MTYREADMDVQARAMKLIGASQSQRVAIISRLTYRATNRVAP